MFTDLVGWAVHSVAHRRHPLSLWIVRFYKIIHHETVSAILFSVPVIHDHMVGAGDAQHIARKVPNPCRVIAQDTDCLSDPRQLDIIGYGIASFYLLQSEERAKQLQSFRGRIREQLAEIWPRRLAQVFGTSTF
jgi:hypothetical protein